MANAPFKALALAPAMTRVQTRLAGASGGDRQMVALLVAAHENGVEAVERACAEALEAGLRSADAILNILSRQSRKASAEPVTPPAHLRLREEPIADCARLTTSSSQRLVVERHELIELMRAARSSPACAPPSTRSCARASSDLRGAAEILGDLLGAELAEKTARSIRCQMSAALAIVLGPMADDGSLPVMKHLAGFDLDAPSVNEAQVARPP